MVHFPRRILIKRKENQNYKDPNQTTQSNTFNESKNKNKPKELLNVNENCSLGPTHTRETFKNPTFKQSLLLNQHSTFNSSNQREENFHKRPRNESQVIKAKTSLENLNQIQ